MKLHQKSEESLVKANGGYLWLPGWQDPRGAAEETRQGINLQFLPASKSQDIILEQQVPNDILYGSSSPINRTET
ncbi:hypothetical protein AV530_006614 [Patagioenas fasciata monilis]|uniref:Uncharacterized protein n=1 Tax=Patagioenas fasciata monilis TaxID=372326 RepID=A0A1V4KH55_PATFA|nr:hypothetical protein AV530_006614 [Patagioenas fasciata monilis]